MAKRFLIWLDRYIYVDRLRLRPHLVVPRMSWWQWIWYVAVIAGAAVLLPYLSGRVDQVVGSIPVLRSVPFVVTWPLLLLYWIGMTFLLPARSARAAPTGEGWLIVVIWILAGVARLMWTGRDMRP